MWDAVRGARLLAAVDLVHIDGPSICGIQHAIDPIDVGILKKPDPDMPEHAGFQSLQPGKRASVHVSEGIDLRNGGITDCVDPLSEVLAEIMFAFVTPRRVTA